MSETARASVADLDERRDRALMERIVAQDEGAFAEVYERYSPQAFGLAVRILGERGLAEEVLQEVFVSVWKGAARFDGTRGSVRSWLLTQIHHRAVDVVRREEAERRRTTTSTIESTARGPDDIVEEGFLVARRAQVRDALATLPDGHRQVLELAYFGGLTQTEVATRIGVPLGTVKSRTLAAMRRLRDRLTEQDPA